MSSLTHWRRHVHRYGRDLGVPRGARVPIATGLFAVGGLALVSRVMLKTWNPFALLALLPSKKAGAAPQPPAGSKQLTGSNVIFSSLTGDTVPAPKVGDLVGVDIGATPGNMPNLTFTSSSVSFQATIVFVAADGSSAVIQVPSTFTTTQVSSTDVVSPNDLLFARNKGR